MNKQDILQLISDTVGVDIEEINLNSSFYDDLNCDPKAMVELKLQLEDLLKTSLDEDEFSEIETVEDLIGLVEENSDEFLG